MKVIKRDYHLKSKNSLKRDDTRSIVKIFLSKILKILNSFIKRCVNEIFKIDLIL
jgi:hypothetical protein